MKFNTEIKDGIAIVTTAVEKLDALHAPELKAEFVRIAQEEGCTHMVLDLTASRYCDSSGLSAVLVGNRLCRDNNGTFVICGMQPAVEKLVNISQLDRVLTITPTASEAFDYQVMEMTQKELGDTSNN